MDLGLEDRVVAVTGGSKGIGLACAAAFAAEGARVAIVSRSREHLDAALVHVRGGKHRPVAFAADLVDAAAARGAIDAIEEALGPIDVLVNSAGADEPDLGRRRRRGGHRGGHGAFYGARGGRRRPAGPRRISAGRSCSILPP